MKNIQTINEFNSHKILNESTISIEQLADKMVQLVKDLDFSITSADRYLKRDLLDVLYGNVRTRNRKDNEKPYIHPEDEYMKRDGFTPGLGYHG